MPETGPRATVVVVQREAFAHTQRSIESLYATAGAPFDCIYVDGGSPPAVQRTIEDASARHGFRLLRYERFLTPNAARNLALPLVTTDYVVFADNDLIFRDDWLRRLIVCADETGADVVGPLICAGSPPFRKVHAAGGEVRVVETSAGRYLHEKPRFFEARLAGVGSRMVREPTEMLEFHCILTRRSVFDRIGRLDEALLSASEHLDLCMLVRRSGGTVWFEPGAVVNQFLPHVFPFDRQSRPFFYARWNRADNRATIDHFQAKWNLSAGDRFSEHTYDWCNDRKDIIFRFLQPKYFRYALRKLQRISRRLVQRA